MKYSGTLAFRSDTNILTADNLMFTIPALGIQNTTLEYLVNSYALKVVYLSLCTCQGSPRPSSELYSGYRFAPLVGVNLNASESF